MALRLPIATQSVRRASRTRRVLTIAFASAVYVLLPLRLMLAALSIATWTSNWKTVDILSTPLVGPFRFIGLLDQAILGNATIAEFVAFAAFGALSIYLLALLTVRRQR